MSSHRATLFVYGLTIFLGATLLFLVQLIFARLALPLLGGAPAVWNTAMVFFQAVLLAGYAYAHWLSSKVRPAMQMKIHLAVLLLPLISLPVAIPAGWQIPTEGNPIPWLLGLLAVAVGMPFFAVSTTSPLLQKWFASTSHPAAKDPYFLYAASNAGSLVGLLGYPLVIEPNTALKWQGSAWSVGFGLLIALMLACGSLTRGSSVKSTPGVVVDEPPVLPICRIRWLVYALVPSSLMLSVTAYISTDIAAVPMLWAIPLALYLLTFIVAFSRRPLVSHALARRALPLLLVAVVMVLAMGATTPLSLLMGLHLAAFFVAALVCHGELARDRPSPRHLTEFYLWMSAGGAIGGIFNGLLAPVLFNRLTEYPLMLVAAAWIGLSKGGQAMGYRKLSLAVVPALLAILLSLALPAHWENSLLRNIIVFGVPAVFCFLASRDGIRFALAIGGVLLVSRFLPEHESRTLFAGRSFFGIHRVTESGQGRFHLLFHGKTVHGIQSLDPAQRKVPLSYYHPTGPLGQIFTTRGSRPVAAVGLGAGAAAAYGKAGQEFTFYEIDPSVKRIASDPRYFTYLADSPAHIEVITGDARLKLSTAPDAHFELIILDAYGSDSVPAHLLTREALQLYLRKLAPGGLIAFHISNLHMDLRPVVGNLAHDGGLPCLFQEDADFQEAESTMGKAPSRWAVVARHDSDLELFLRSNRWQSLAPDARLKVWTDDYSSILPLLDFKLH